MRPGTATLLAKAERAAATAAAALAAGAPAVAGGRAFYALLYAAKARLNERGLRRRTHAGVAATLARLAPSLSPPLADQLASAIARRRRADAEELTYVEAEQMVEQARAAVEVARADIDL